MNSIEHASSDITRDQVADLIDAAMFAWRTDRPLTRSLTFNLKSSEIRPQEFVSAFTKLAGDWLRTRKAGRAYLWILEHPPSKSLNLHLLIHVPNNLMVGFAKKERNWVRQAGIAWRRNFLLSQKIGIPRGKRTRTIEGGEYLVNLERALGYMMKGGDVETCNILRIDQKPQGIIRGKRVGVAEAIGKKARNESGYRFPRSDRASLLFNRRYRLEAGLG